MDGAQALAGRWLADLGLWAETADSDSFWLVCGLLAIAALVTVFQGFGRLRRARLIEDTPTSRVRSAAQGYVELEGRATCLPGPEIYSPLTRSPCVWWRYRVQQRRGSGRNARWVTLESGTSDALFLLDDGTGACVIDPEGARVFPNLHRQWRGSTPRPLRHPPARNSGGLSFAFGFGGYRYSESLIGRDAPLHALGAFTTVRAAQDADSEVELRELLAAWKRDRASLLARFDANADGEVDLQEWETARREAMAQVRRENAARPQPPDAHVLRRPPDGRLFLLSTLPQRGLAARKRWTAVTLLALTVIAASLLLVLLPARLA